uniref:Uncharacterized protein n=1 Tax=Anguilla anguilla TaxID=7936 RepID=A0A0E9VRC0_ANGAN
MLHEGKHLAKLTTHLEMTQRLPARIKANNCILTLQITPYTLASRFVEISVWTCHYK